MFANDQVIMAGGKHNIEYMKRKLAETYKANGLEEIERISQSDATGNVLLLRNSVYFY